MEVSAKWTFEIGELNQLHRCRRRNIGRPADNFFNFLGKLRRVGSFQNHSRRIAERFDPEKIISFGSYAYGSPRPDSDIDLLVIMESHNFHIVPATTFGTSVHAAQITFIIRN